MASFALLGGTIVVGLAYLQNPDRTITLVTSIIAVRGVTWLATKIIGALKKDNAEIVNYIGWCVAGVACIALLKTAIMGAPIAGEKLGGFAEWIDRITFWN